MWPTWARPFLTRLFSLRFYFARKWRSLAPGNRHRLTSTQQQILGALVQGAHLKSHRTLDGAKEYRLHRADGSVLQRVEAADVARLRRAGLITGNMKFPAATYLLTAAGLRVAADQGYSTLRPLTPR